MQVVHHNLTSRWGKICVNTVSHAKCYVGQPHHVGSTCDSLPVTGCLPTNLVTHSSGRVHTCHLLNCCQRHMVWLTCYKANNTIHSLKISFGNWFLLFDVYVHGNICELFIPSCEKDSSAVNEMTLNCWECAVIQWLLLIHRARSPRWRCWTLQSW